MSEREKWQPLVKPQLARYRDFNTFEGIQELALSEAIEFAFPQVPKEIIETSDQLINGFCASLPFRQEHGPFVRGGLVMNLIKPSLAGPEIGRQFRLLAERVGYDTLARNRLWQTALFTGVHQDIDIFYCAPFEYSLYGLSQDQAKISRDDPWQFETAFKESS